MITFSIRCLNTCRDKILQTKEKINNKMSLWDTDALLRFYISILNGKG